jgi:5-oxoprolinase (ATP-hydrolysing)
VLETRCSQALASQGFPQARIKTEVILNLRYQGTDTSMMIVKPEDSWDFSSSFLDKYKAEFGFTLDRDLVVDDIRVRGIGKSMHQSRPSDVYQEYDTLPRKRLDQAEAERVTSVYWGSAGRVETPVFNLPSLPKGTEIVGPALIVEKNSTIVVEPDCHALITTDQVVITISEASHKLKVKQSCELDPIQLSIFGHRFMSIAGMCLNCLDLILCTKNNIEQMGYTLQKTSISTNIKERLDFSCAIFGPDAGLVANAPHIPVHLGSMQEAVRWQLEFRGHSIEEGDVLVTNHPAAGGSHLPDITVITPVFDRGKIVFFVASRGHHADIGGMAAGSMPPNSKELYQEGAAIKTFKLVQKGRFDEDGITKILLKDPAQYEGCSGTRCLRDNISDLKAQVAANHRGITLVKSLIQEYSMSSVLF